MSLLVWILLGFLGSVFFFLSGYTFNRLMREGPFRFRVWHVVLLMFATSLGVIAAFVGLVTLVTALGLYFFDSDSPGYVSSPNALKETKSYIRKCLSFVLFKKEV